MATEILVNDGGAPARILPFLIHATVAAGDPLDIHTNGKVKPSATSGSAIAGVALTAASGLDNMASVITGKGVVLKVNTNGTVTQGMLLTVNGAGKFAKKLTADTAVGVALEAASGNVCKALIF